MKCPICKHGDLEKGLSSFVVELYKSTIIFKNTPALICNVCAEVYFEEDITQTLFTKAKEIASAEVELDIRDFQKVAA